MVSLLSPSFQIVLIDVYSLATSAIARKSHSLKSTSGSGDTGEHKIVEEIVHSIIAYLRSYVLLNRDNLLYILCHDLKDTYKLFPRAETFNDISNRSMDFRVKLTDIIIDTFNILFEKVNQCIESIKQTQNTNSQGSKPRGKLGTALSSALTVIHRLQSRQPHLLHRILVLQFDRDNLQTYNTLMSCIFSAQKMHVLIDALQISNFDSNLMQQACFLTGGQYIKHSNIAELSLVLIANYLPDQNIRQMIMQPNQRIVDFKASCFCHKKPVEFAYMCSVCLTLLCEDSPRDRCPNCETQAN